MKKIVASVGLVALGASGIQTTSDQVIGSPDASKPWSLSATLRGFYDSNTATLPFGVNPAPGQSKDSFGFEVSPSAAIVWSVEQTTLSLGLLYSFKYYDDKPPNSSDHSDQAFTFNAGLTHDFSERYRARVYDSFVIGQEPDFLRAGNALSTFQRVSGDNIRNYGAIGFDAQLNPEFGLGFGYDNAFYKYADDTPSIPLVGQVSPSLGGVLNRIENRAHAEALWQFQPDTKARLGYQFTDFMYTGDQLIGGAVLGPFIFSPVYSDDKNSREHTGYLGIEHNFSPVLVGSIRAGASYTDYYNDPYSNDGSTWTPYVNA